MIVMAPIDMDEMCSALEERDAAPLIKLIGYYQQSERFDFEMFLHFKSELEECGHDMSELHMEEDFNS